MIFGVTPIEYWPGNYWPVVALDHGTPQRVTSGNFDISSDPQFNFVIGEPIPFDTEDVILSEAE